MTARLSPFVFWAQTESTISLRIDLRNVQVPNIELSENVLIFAAKGHGAKGEHIYEFNLNFHRAIDKESSKCRITDRQVEFNITKAENDWWPRLTNDVKKPLWLKIDFDKWKNEDDENEDTQILPSDTKDQYTEDLMKKLKEAENIQLPVEFFRKIYLFLYNLIQFALYTYVVVVLLNNYIRQGPAFMDVTYDTVGYTIKFCQGLQLLEIIHPLLGYTRGNLLPPFFQVFGRFMVLFFIIGGEPRMQTKPFIFYLFLVWSLVEVVRYPYYMLKVWNFNVKFLTWLRYTIWIVLYPLGFLCEGTILLRSIPYYEETQKFSILLPNKMNFSFSFYTTIKVFLLIGFFPTMFFLMTNMYRQRVKIIGPKSWQKKNKKA